MQDLVEAVDAPEREHVRGVAAADEDDVLRERQPAEVLRRPGKELDDLDGRNARERLRRVLGSVDPIRFIALARPGSLLLEDGRKDEIVPRSALLNIVHAAPKGTPVRWYDAPHGLNRAAYRDAFAWLARKLPIQGAPVHGAATA